MRSADFRCDKTFTIKDLNELSMESSECLNGRSNGRFYWICAKTTSALMLRKRSRTIGVFANRIDSNKSHKKLKACYFVTLRTSITGKFLFFFIDAMPSNVWANWKHTSGIDLVYWKKTRTHRAKRYTRVSLTEILWINDDHYIVMVSIQLRRMAVFTCKYA